MKRKDVKIGDILKYTNYYGSQCFIVDGIEEDSVTGYISFSIKDHFGSADEDIEVNIEKCKKAKTLKVSKEKLHDFFAYNISFNDLIGGDKSIEAIVCDDYVNLSLDELLEGLKKCKNNKKSIEEYLQYLSAVYHMVVSKNRVPIFGYDGKFEGLMNENSLVYDTVNYINFDGEDAYASINDYIKEISTEIKKRKISFINRDYSDSVMLAYVNHYSRHNEARLETITAEEKKLYKRFLDYLCKKKDAQAMEIIAYQYYCGSPVYKQDFKKAEKIILDLMKIDNNPFLANTLGYIYYYGRVNNGKPQYDKAFKYFSIAAAFDMYEAKYKLADMFYHGYYVDANYKICNHIVKSLYYENRERFLNGEYYSKFADVALRMGSLFKNGIYEPVDYEIAYNHFLEARAALKLRMSRIDYYGDSSVLKNIDDELAKCKKKMKKNDDIGYFNSFNDLIGMAKKSKEKIKCTIIKKEKDKYDLVFEKIEKTNNGRLFLVSPKHGFAGFVDKIEVNLSVFDGKKLEFANDIKVKKETTIIIDSYDYPCFYCNGEKVLQLPYSYDFVIKNKFSNKLYKIASVTFDGSSKKYDYICKSKGLKVGRKVLVDAIGAKEEVTIRSIEKKKECNLLLPIEKYKYI